MIPIVAVHGDQVADSEGHIDVLAGSELPRLRHIYLSSAKPWVAADFRGRSDSVAPLRWLEGGPNSVLVHGPEGSAVKDVISDIVESRARAEVLIDGAALGSVQILVDAGWVCVDVRPFMRRVARPSAYDAAVRLSTAASTSADVVAELFSPRDLAVAGQVMAEAFGFDPSAAYQSMRSGQERTSDRRVWALRHDGDVVSCATTVQVDDTIVLWDVATRPTCQRHGYGTALVNAIHNQCADASNVHQFLLSSSTMGYHVYESLGYETIAWWQAWSRPRWNLGRA
jgi:predicted GNAT family acetyltransferase